MAKAQTVTKSKKAEPAAVDRSRGQQQREQRTERQGELKTAARKMWEEMRRQDISASQRATKVDEMLGLLGGQLAAVGLKHDMSRMVQSCLKHGNSQQREAIGRELEKSGAWKDLARSTYGRHILGAVLKYCPAQRAPLMEALKGSVRRLVRQRDAADVVEECYAVYANARQRWGLAAEFYGAEVALFEAEGVLGVAEVLERRPEKRAAVVSSLKAALGPMLEKGTVQQSVVHRALLDYLRLGDSAERARVAGDLRELAVEMVHTREGAAAAMLCVAYGTPKDRKAMVRAFKPFLRKMCLDEYGYATVIQALDCVDDTVLLSKALLHDIGGMVGDLAMDVYGRRVPLYVLAGRNPQYVGSDCLSVLKEAEGSGKKDPVQRRVELTRALSPMLLEWAAANARTAVFDAQPSQLLTETLLRAMGDKQAVWQIILDLLQVDPAAVDRAAHVLLSPIANRVVTTCIMAEYREPKCPDSAAVPPLPQENPKFGTDVLATLHDAGHLVAAAQAGAFPVRALLESPVTGERARQLLKPHVKEIQQGGSGPTTQAILKQLA
ncbi:Pumilio y domain member 6 [Coemansia sp. RSA 552]|nr:Pumilio y domain member 6 [Coemansia sp. RSA 552]